MRQENYVKYSGQYYDAITQKNRHPEMQKLFHCKITLFLILFSGFIFKLNYLKLRYTVEITYNPCAINLYIY